MLNEETFLKRAKEKHGNKYDYSKVEYVNVSTKVCIICPIHGEFWQTPHCHTRKRHNGCPLCANKKRNKTQTTEEWISKAKEIHGNKYDYSKVGYKNHTTRVCIICPEHGEFYQRPYDHLSYHECPKCNGKEVYNNNDFVVKAKLVHGDKYDYSKVEYINTSTKVCIICSEHGEFWQRPNKHLHGQGCPKCFYYKGENLLYNFLKNKFDNVEQQHSTTFLGRQRIDFYLPKHNIGIELQGRQHFEPVDYFGGEDEYYNIVERDIRKKKLCEDNNLKLFYISLDKRNVNKKYDYKISYSLNSLYNNIIKYINNGK